MSQPPRRTAFLLTQIGTFAASQFGARVSEYGLNPKDAGILRLIARHPAIGQQALADRLGTPPSRVVTFIDSLEARRLVTRVRSAKDRRNHELNLTEEGQNALKELRQISAEHEAVLLEPLSQEEKIHLGDLLEKLAVAHRLDPDVHPGYSAPPSDHETK
jgi:DNA-binding MarR family transcriptional regulator